MARLEPFKPQRPRAALGLASIAAKVRPAAPGPPALPLDPPLSRTKTLAAPQSGAGRARRCTPTPPHPTHLPTLIFLYAFFFLLFTCCSRTSTTADVELGGTGGLAGRQRDRVGKAVQNCFSAPFTLIHSRRHNVRKALIYLHTPNFCGGVLLLIMSRSADEAFACSIDV